MARVSAADRRRQLVEAAFRVIGAEGFAAATTRRICAEAGAPVAAFHYCFASKSELFVELTEVTVAALRDAQAGGVHVVGGIGESLRETLRQWWATVEAAPEREVVLTGLTHHAMHEPSLAGVARRQYEAYHRTAATTLSALADACAVTWTLPVEQLARMLVVVTDGVTIAYLVDRDPDAAVRTLDAFARLLAGLTSPS
ncbi:TetR/AcrR family transcriptional regulator [Actinomycetospora sp. NBRC 106378]|uniref:TetR/AcrR family transcriptional regulator n=1 Tax=Actinomycetospora sp. NBRC 106378 TaxID=3032208 RepID=UPI002557418B|nr:TetR/AcrR family transcriptional regulator [Actinomycetospora sp. NBRC 106378]